MRIPVILLLAVLLTGCATGSVPEFPPVTGSDARPDSIVLRRTPCFGTCPVYRLHLSSSGQVTFDDGEVKSDSVSPAVVHALVDYARELDLRSLPDIIDRGSEHCPDYATDHPTIHVALFGSEPKRMRYYTGCYNGTGMHAASGPMQKVEAFAARMDTVTGATRWIRPRRR